MIRVAIMAGGSGTRLAPVSRPDKPKQFHTLLGHRSMLADAVCLAKTAIAPRVDIIAATRHARIIDSMRMSDINLYLEDEPMNTAYTVLTYAQDMPGDDIIVFMPCDHYIPQENHFREAIRQSITLAEEGHIALIGIKPTHPATGYGYILDRKFEEKPEEARAAELIGMGALWNSGILCAKASTLIEDAKIHCPNYLDETATEELSIDHALLQKSHRIEVTPTDMLWSDVGSWGSLLKGPVSIHNLLASFPWPYEEEVTKPWGSYTVLSSTDKFKAKLLRVKPGQILSLQKHEHRDEHWYIVSGAPGFYCEEEGHRFGNYQFIPKGVAHRIFNDGDKDAVVFEIQSGDIISEDDIIRLEDNYGRT